MKIKRREYNEVYELTILFVGITKQAQYNFKIYEQHKTFININCTFSVEKVLSYDSLSKIYAQISSLYSMIEIPKRNVEHINLDEYEEVL